MNLSDLSIEGLSQLETRLAADLEMVKRVKALVVEYQKMGAQSPGLLGRSAAASGLVVSAASAAGAASGPRVAALPRKSEEERLMEGLAKLPSTGFLLNDLQRAAVDEHGHFSRDEVKRWVKSMVRKGKIRVVETRAGRAGNLYAAVDPEASALET